MADIVNFPKPKPKPSKLQTTTNRVIDSLEHLVRAGDGVRMAVSIVLEDEKKERRVISVNNKTNHVQITKYGPEEDFKPVNNK